MKWISIEERLPPDYQEVLYFASIDNGQKKEIMIGHRQNGSWTHCCMFYCTNILNENVLVTHWMELPDFPNGFNEIKENIEYVIREIEKKSPEFSAYLRENIIMDDKQSTFCYAPSNDRMSDERIEELPEKCHSGVLDGFKKE